jgi:hypothetical protein
VPANLVRQRLHLGVNNLNNDRDVDPKVLMNHDVPEPSDAMPGNRFELCPSVLRQRLRGFADNSEIPSVASKAISAMALSWESRWAR